MLKPASPAPATVSGDDIRDTADAVARDFSRVQIVASFAADLREGQLTGEELAGILRTFTFDSAKEAALQALIGKVGKPIPGSSRARIIAEFNSSTSQANAARLLGRQ